MSQQTAAPAKAYEFEENRRMVKRALPALLIVFTLGTLMTQAFNLVFQTIGDSLGMSESAQLISTLPGIVLGIVCMLYGTLCDYLSPKKLTLFGLVALIGGSVLGFLLASNFWAVLLARMIQTAGAQVTGSIFIVMAVKYLNDDEKAVYIGIYGAVYNAANAIGVFAGGIITSIDWRFLLLIPALSLFLAPMLLKNTPDISSTGEKVDVFGISLFAVFAGLIAIYFSFPATWLIIAIIVLAAAFALYVWKGKNPFLSRSIVTNGAYMGSVILILAFWFFAFASIPIYSVLGDLYGVPLYQVSILLAVQSAVGAVVGCCSGLIVNTIGRNRTVILSATLMVLCFLLSSVFVHSGFLVLIGFGCLYVGGLTAIYTPVYDFASEALPVEENGRGIGVCDLCMNTSQSIGMAVYSSLMASAALSAGGVFGAEEGMWAATSNMFLIMAIGSAAALVLYLVFSKTIMKRLLGGR